MKMKLNLITAGADPAFVNRGGPNSEIFLSDLRKLFRREESSF